MLSLFTNSLQKTANNISGLLINRLFVDCLRRDFINSLLIVYVVHVKNNLPSIGKLFLKLRIMKIPSSIINSLLRSVSYRSSDNGCCPAENLSLLQRHFAAAERRLEQVTAGLRGRCHFQMDWLELHPFSTACRGTFRTWINLRPDTDKYRCRYVTYR